MNDSPWWLYVKSLDPGATKDRLAKRAGITASTITRWSQGRSPAADAAIQTARAFGRSPLEALLAANLITAEESGGTWQGRTIEDMDTLHLVWELERRVRADGRSGEEIRRAAAGEPSEDAGDAEQRQLPPALPLAARRRRGVVEVPVDERAVAFAPGVSPEDDAQDEVD